MEILSINTLDIGQKLTNIELYVILGCSNSGGMRRAKKTNSLIIISSHVEPIYEDRWDGDILLYMSLYVGYDSEKIREYAKNHAMIAVIPRKFNSAKRNPEFDAYLYKLRHLAENSFARLKHFRSIAARFDKLARNYKAVLRLAYIFIWCKAK